jgi:hypothetical protein
MVFMKYPLGWNQKSDPAVDHAPGMGVCSASHIGKQVPQLRRRLTACVVVCATLFADANGLISG